MKSEIKDVAACRKHISVEVPAEKVEQVFDESYKMLQHNVQLKGFRKGHAPRRMLEKKFGGEILSDVKSRLFQDSFMEALKENDLSPMGDPDLKISDIELTVGQPFKYETEVDIRPKFDIPEYKGLKLVEKVEVVTDADIDEQLKNLCERFAMPEPVDGKSKEKDLLEVDVLMTAGDETLIDEKAQRVRIEGDKLFALDCKDMVKQLSGLAAGGEKKITIKLPDDFHDEALRGKDAKIELKVTQVLRAELPEIDEDFAKRLGMDSVETLRKQIGSNIEQERKQGARQQVEQDSVDQLIAACTFDLPEEFMKRQTEAAIMRSTYQLAQMGVTKDFLEERRDEMEKSSREETERSVRRSVIFDAIADKEELDITEAEFQAHIENLSRAYQTTPAKILKRIQDNDGLAAMASEIRDIKVTKLILDSAEITSEEKA